MRKSLYIEPFSGIAGDMFVGALLDAGASFDAVRAAVAALPERLRLPLVLRYYSELSYDQIAAELDLNRNTVATLILRAKKELRRALRRAPSKWLQ